MVCPMCSQLVERQMQLRVLYVDADNVSKYEGGGGTKNYLVCKGSPMIIFGTHFTDKANWPEKLNFVWKHPEVV